ETNSSSAPPPAVRSATVTSAGPSPRTDRAGARSGAPTRLRSLSVICLRYHSRHGLRKGSAAALSPFPCTRDHGAAPASVGSDRPFAQLRSSCRWPGISAVTGPERRVGRSGMFVMLRMRGSGPCQLLSRGGSAAMSEEQMVDLVQDALTARGITDEVLAAGQFNPR